MSKERLARIKDTVNIEFEITKKIVHLTNDDDYKYLSFGIMYKNINWLIEQAERICEVDRLLDGTWYDRASKKSGELNEFLQKRHSIGVGDHVVDVAIDHIKKQEDRLMGSELDRRELVEENKRYRELLNELDVDFEASIHYEFSDAKTAFLSGRRAIQKALEESK